MVRPCGATNQASKPLSLQASKLPPRPKGASPHESDPRRPLRPAARLAADGAWIEEGRLEAVNLNAGTGKKAFWKIPRESAVALARHMAEGV